ncbi:glycosyl hydrolase family 28-related protein [Paenibacillus glycinis]|uniref:Rhamnogalacturonase A/B/Epimerase-like pectate lyase domain-containing protein n=1 Tax=Paenibacillus glycinis TaxID=2697035 RepID=A0ABW9XMA0_9BACL|nr:glycosyl hydrolase family 28-related protein [Paenibacillus glycinis]NBD23591.1 hypothetical protein [Paenibacillus glycinis]
MADPAGIFSVTSYGAVGNGTADDTAALQNAINAAFSAGGGVVWLPPGKFKTSSTLVLPNVNRPNTAGTQGSGITIKGAGMYSSGILYAGTGFAIYSDKTIADTVLFEDFYINHRNGSGVGLPQGAHQMFNRFFSSACGTGKYGVYIQGNRSAQNNTGGVGAYMLSFNNCRFWSETGYNGTGVLLENLFMCASFDNCFFSRAVNNYPHLWLKNSVSVHITDSAFERSEYQAVLPPAIANSTAYTPEQKEAIRATMSTTVNNAITEPLIRLDDSHAISILECHAEATFPAFVGVYGGSTNVLIDGCRLDHYAITTYNGMKGYIVQVDPASTDSRRIIVGKRNYYSQTNHPDTTHGPVILDPVNAVTMLGFEDVTPFANQNYKTERRTIPLSGQSGNNMLKNPSFYSDQPNGVPFGVETPSGSYSFAQLAPAGCKITQSLTAPGTPYRLRTRAIERFNKYSAYTLFITGRNQTGKSIDLYVDYGGNGVNDRTLILPSGNQLFTLTTQIPATNSDIIDLVVYQKLELDLLAMYLVPGITTEAPYASELLSGYKLNLGSEIRYAQSKPTSGGATGDLVLNRQPVYGKEAGWVCVAANNWQPFGVVGGDAKMLLYTTLPTATDSNRGTFAYVEKAGSDGSVYVSVKNANGTFAWKKIL